MVNKSKGVLAFIKRRCKEFVDPYNTKTLYVALVRQVLYSSYVWSPQYKSIKPLSNLYKYNF